MAFKGEIYPIGDTSRRFRNPPKAIKKESHI